MVANLGDDWQIVALGYIRSQAALPKLYSLLGKSSKVMKITIAHAILRVCGNMKMIDLVLQELPKVSSQFELIDVVYMLPVFKDKRLTVLLDEYRHHPDYLVAYNATRAMQLPAEAVVEQFRTKEIKSQSFWKRLFG